MHSYDKWNKLKFLAIVLAFHARRVLAYPYHLITVCLAKIRQIVGFLTRSNTYWSFGQKLSTNCTAFTGVLKAHILKAQISNQVIEEVPNLVTTYPNYESCNNVIILHLQSFGKLCSQVFTSTIIRRRTMFSSNLITRSSSKTTEMSKFSEDIFIHAKMIKSLENRRLPHWTAGYHFEPQDGQLP